MSTIVIYDSGVGGLSIYQEVIRECPNHSYIFLSDNQAFPYGTKSEADLVARVAKVVSRVDEHFAPDLMVVACNTASTVTLDSLRAQFDFEIVGVVPAIKPAAQISKSKVIGLLATPGTVNRQYTQDLINSYASDCKVHSLGSSELVELSEAKLRGQSVDVQRLSTILKPLAEIDNLDVVVLACTHFPLLRAEISTILGSGIELVDSGHAIANRVAKLSDSLSASDDLPIAVFTQAINEPVFFNELVRLSFDEIQVLTISN